MNKGGKINSIERANKLLEERAIHGSNIIKESNDLSIGTQIVTFKGKIHGTIVAIKYVTELKNGEIVELKEGEFYNNSPTDDLPF